MANTLYLSLGENGAIFRGRPNNEANSGPLVRENSGVNDVLYQAAANNGGGGSYTIAVAGGSGRGIILTTTRTGNESGTWTVSYTGTRPLNGVIYGDGDWVACGTGDTILLSGNGTTWTATSTGIKGANWRWAAYGAGRFVVVGNAGYAASSTDGGFTWTRENTGTKNTLNSVSYSNTLRKFMAVGTGGTLIEVGVE